jgi:hypothetical protein
VIDEHFVMVVFGAVLIALAGVLVGGGVERHEGRHFHLFGVGFLFGFGLFLGLAVFGPIFLGPSTGDLEAFDVVFLAAAGFGLLLGQQCLSVGDRDLVIIGMDFGEGQEALAVAAIFDKGCLQRRLYARHLGEIDIAFERPLGGGLKIKLFDPGTVHNHHAGLFRVAGVDEHTFGHGNLRRARAGRRRHAVRRASCRQTVGGAN